MGQDSLLEKIQSLEHVLLIWTNGKEKKITVKQIHETCGKVEKYRKI